MTVPSKTPREIGLESALLHQRLEMNRVYKEKEKLARELAGARLMLHTIEGAFLNARVQGLHAPEGLHQRHLDDFFSNKKAAKTTGPMTPPPATLHITRAYVEDGDNPPQVWLSNGSRLEGITFLDVTVKPYDVVTVELRATVMNEREHDDL